MDVYTSEEQQIEAIKKWWQKNAKAVLFLVWPLCSADAHGWIIGVPMPRQHQFNMRL